MKNKRLFYFLMFLPLFSVLISLQFLPDQIPAHYGITGEVDRWGSKYEVFIFPGITIIFGLVILIITKYAAKQEKDGNNNQKIGFITGILLLLLFNIMTFYFLYTDIIKAENLAVVFIDPMQLIFISLGMIIMFIGNIMPKAKINSMIGLRTTWSMKNEITWRKSQRFGGISFIVDGILIIVGCCFTKGFVCYLWSISILILSLPIDIYYTYKVAKKYN